MDLISSTTPKARKVHFCDACEIMFFQEGHIEHFDSIEEFREYYYPYLAAKQNNFRIQIGQKYIRQFLSEGGDSWTYKAIPEIHELCMKYLDD